MPNRSWFLIAVVWGVLAFSLYPDLLWAKQSSSDKPLMLITWFGPGAIVLPSGGDWKPEMLTVYDDGTRPVAQFTKGPELTASFILFENRSGKPNAAGCRDDAIGPIVEHSAREISRRVDGDLQTDGSTKIATTSFLFAMGPAAGHLQHNLFGFVGDAKVCAEIHLSTVSQSPTADDTLKSLLSSFHPDLAYKPEAIDYFRIASVLFKNSPGLAAPYYKSSLDAMPASADFSTMRRVITDQLVMSLGMSGDLKNSRAVAEKAIASDPDYPINYYNLACADAEQGDAAAAKTHLQMAFDRRANVLQGESMPDPSKDDSILKLKKNKEFWAFVLALPKH